MPTNRGLRATLASLMLVAALLAGCSDEEEDPSTVLPDPCALLTKPLLDRLAPDADPPQGDDGIPETSGTGYLSCTVDLSTSPVGGYRGDLSVEVWVDNIETFDEDWQQEHCLEVDAEVTSEGPGDTGCISVQPNDGLESRVDAWAWVGHDYEVNVSYQLIFPEELPDTAEEDVRNLLYAAVDELPVGQSS